MKRDDSSPKAYRGDVDGELSEMLESVRSIIFEVVEDIEETIQYGMLDYPGLCNLAAQKNYVALYVKPAVLDDFRDRVPDCGKSCVRFRKLAHLDRELVAELLAAVWADRTA